MAANRLEIAVNHQGSVTVLDLRGEVDAFGEKALLAAYAQAERENSVVVLLDFNRVTYINSKGIALIVGLLKQALNTNRRLLACNLSSHFLEIFKITRLSDYIAIYPDAHSALAEVAPSAELIKEK